MRVLVTGGAGFVGHHLVGALVDRGDDVVVIDSLITGRAARLERLAERITMLVGDIRDPDAIRRAVDGAELVFHLAALPSVARSLAHPLLTNDIATRGTIEVVRAAARAGVRRIVFASSSSVYGNSPELPRREAQAPAPAAPYAVSKLAAEGYLHSLGGVLGVETVALRYFNVFGPSQDPDSPYSAVIPRFITAAIRGQRPIVQGDGHQSRDFTYVDNVVAANLDAATAPDASGLICNIAAGEQRSVLELWAAIAAAAGCPLEPIHEPGRPADVRHSRADISVAVACLGYRVRVPFADGIAATVEWYRRNSGG